MNFPAWVACTNNKITCFQLRSQVASLHQRCLLSSDSHLKFPQGIQRQETLETPDKHLKLQEKAKF
jgi:hypothetical protein